MSITTEQVKALRDKTGVSVMQCKKALEEADGNMEKAILILKQKSTDIAAKKSDREAKDGLIVVKKNGNNISKAVALMLNCETDFVAKNSDFISLANSLAEIALSEGADTMRKKAPEMISPVVQKIGENIQLGEVKEITGDILGDYVHGGKLAVIITLSGGTEELARDIAMHTAAMKPEFISMDEITPETRESLKSIFQKEVDESGKPEEIKKKMLEGKIATYLKERVLTEQAFIKNGDVTIGKLLAQARAKVTSWYTVRI